MIDPCPQLDKLEHVGFQVETFPFDHELPGALLYNQQAYLEQNNTQGLFRFVSLRGGEVLIQANLYTRNGSAENAPFSGFGGIEFVEGAEPFLGAFIAGIENWCRAQGIKEISLKLPPWIYFRKLSFLENILMHSGFSVRFKEVNQHLELSHVPLAQRMKPDGNRRLRRCHEAGFRFVQLDIVDLPVAYGLIEKNHQRRGFPVTMTLESLEKMFRSFPGYYLLFGVFDRTKLIATAVSVRVCPGVLYNFYHGSHENYQNFSPILQVIEGVYQYCQTQRVKYLDIGISSVKGKLNEGLYRFKKNCGCVDADKKLFYKQL